MNIDDFVSQLKNMTDEELEEYHKNLQARRKQRPVAEKKAPKDSAVDKLTKQQKLLNEIDNLF